MWLDILGQMIASNYATAFCVVALIVAGAFYWWRVIPMMEEHKKYFEELEALRDLDATRKTSDGASAELALELAQVRQIVTALSESAPVDNLDMKEGLNSILRAVQRFERIISQQSRDHQSSTELMREVMDGIAELRQELVLLNVRLQSISSSLHTSPNGSGHAGINDLRALK